MARTSFENRVFLVEVDPLRDLADEPSIRQFSEELFAGVRALTEPLVVVDLSQARFIGSSVIEALLRSWHDIKARRGKLALCGLNAACREVLAVSKLDSLWRPFDTREAALAALAGAG